MYSTYIYSKKCIKLGTLYSNWMMNSFHGFAGRLIVLPNHHLQRCHVQTASLLSSPTLLINSKLSIAEKKDLFQNTSDQIENKLKLLREKGDINEKQQQITELETQLADPSLWDQDHKLTRLSREHANLVKQISTYEEISRSYNDIMQLYTMAAEENDETMINETLIDANRLLQKVTDMQWKILMCGEHDSKECYLQVVAGSGGIEAQDWAETLLNMYIKYCKKNEWSYKIIESRPCDVGIQQAVIHIGGEYSYGWLAREQGVHRRCRVSPYGNASGLVHTVFASVTIQPVLKTKSEGLIEIREKDLIVESFCAPGPGGQHRNKNETAIRIKHIPTGVIVVGKEERSQFANRQVAYELLRFKLRQMEENKEKKRKQDEYDSLEDCGFGSDTVRYYKYHGNVQVVKDNRTGFEIRNPRSVLDGNIEPFLQASLEASLSLT